MGIYKVSSLELGVWMLLWGTFTLYLAMGSAFLKLRAVTIVLALLTILFYLLLSIAYLADSTELLRFAGAWGIVTGLTAIYTTVAIIVNTSAGKQLLPQ